MTSRAVTGLISSPTPPATAGELVVIGAQGGLDSARGGALDWRRVGREAGGEPNGRLITLYLYYTIRVRRRVIL